MFCTTHNSTIAQSALVTNLHFLSVCVILIVLRQLPNDRRDFVLHAPQRLNVGLSKQHSPACGVHLFYEENTMTSIRLKQINICSHCGQSFHPYGKNQQYCSIVCFTPRRSENRKKRANYICEVCGKTFEAQTYRTARYCSKTCWQTRRKPKIKICPNCHIAFDSHDKRAIYCSANCVYQHKVGPLSPVWKGGASLARARARQGNDLANWRKSIYKRDKYTCQICGNTGNIHAHHIKDYANHPALRLDVNNGLTVCIPCHETIHNKKIGSPGKYPKHCIDCGTPTSGKAERCKSCGSKHGHLSQGHKAPKNCLQCGKEFIPPRGDYKYCSPKCGTQSTLSNITVNCSICGKPVLRTTCLVKKNKGRWFCSYKCQKARKQNLIELKCVICRQLFYVKPYRANTAKTCSKTCGYKYISLKHVLAKQEKDSSGLTVPNKR